MFTSSWEPHPRARLARLRDTQRFSLLAGLTAFALAAIFSAAAPLGGDTASRLLALDAAPRASDAQTTTVAGPSARWLRESPPMFVPRLELPDTEDPSLTIMTPLHVCSKHVC
jgi:hypothetical protein